MNIEMLSDKQLVKSQEDLVSGDLIFYWRPANVGSGREPRYGCFLSPETLLQKANKIPSSLTQFWATWSSTPEQAEEKFNDFIHDNMTHVSPTHCVNEKIYLLKRTKDDPIERIMLKMGY